jgi:endonuclease YncB( thermonuclease family)
VVRVYDGDTLFIEKLGKQYPVRLRNIDAAEMRSKCTKEHEQALSAKAALQYLVLGKIVRLENVGSDYYHRILADVYVDNMSVGAKLVELGVVRRYKGKRYGWC